MFCVPALVKDPARQYVVLPTKKTEVDAPSLRAHFFNAFHGAVFSYGYRSVPNRTVPTLSQKAVSYERGFS